MPMGKCCCWCEYEDCPRICVGNNPCTTRLVVSGNHPADLIYPITYTSDPGPLGPFPKGCGLVGEASPNLAASTGHTHLKSWTAGIRYWDSVDRTAYVCCGFGPYTEHPAFREVGSGVHVTGTCSRADMRYSGLKVLLRRDKILLYGEWVCVVRADVCLKVKRHIETQWKTCHYETITNTIYDLPFECGIIQGQTGTYTGTCGWCQANNGPRSSYPNPGDITQAPYPSISCPELTDAQWEARGEYCFWRSKYFMLSSIACGPITLTFGPEDDQPNFDSSCCAGLTQPPITMYEPDDDPVATPCGGQSLTNCPRTNPTTTDYGSWNTPPFDPFGVIVNDPPFCSENSGGFGGLFINKCLPRFKEDARNQGWSRTGGWTGNPKLLAEVEDTWTLHLDCSASS
jgi:hypothetical protein